MSEDKKKPLAQRHPTLAKATKIVLVSGGVINAGLLFQFQLRSDAKAEYDRLHSEQVRIWSAHNDLRKEVKMDLHDALDRIEKNIDRRLDKFESKLETHNKE